MAYDEELAVAIEAAREAASLCQDVREEMASTPGEALTKEDRSPVTVADFGSQALVCRRLRESFPDDAIVAEEDAAALRTRDNREVLERVVGYVARYQAADGDAVNAWIALGGCGAETRYWTVDPIDGTKGFLRQDQYAIALALVEDGRVKVGVLACPALPIGDGVGCLFAASSDGGAWQMKLGGGDRTAIRVAGDSQTESRRFVESVETDHGNHALQRRIAAAAGIDTPSLRMDSQAKYGAVARGDALLYLRLPSPKHADYLEKVWDHAAGVLVVEEAGGTVTDSGGERLDFGVGSRLALNCGIVASNGRIHGSVIKALAASGSG